MYFIFYLSSVRFGSNVVHFINVSSKYLGFCCVQMGNSIRLIGPKISYAGENHFPKFFEIVVDGFHLLTLYLHAISSSCQLFSLFYGLSRLAFKIIWLGVHCSHDGKAHNIDLCITPMIFYRCTLMMDAIILNGHSGLSIDMIIWNLSHKHLIRWNKMESITFFDLTSCRPAFTTWLKWL